MARLTSLGSVGNGEYPVTNCCATDRRVLMAERMQTEGYDWEPVIARSLGYLCLDAADLGKRTVLERADFLMGLGFPRRDAAIVLGTSDESLRVLANQRAKKQASNGKAKAKAKAKAKGV
jgi:hypothetical protein